MQLDKKVLYFFAPLVSWSQIQLLSVGPVFDFSNKNFSVVARILEVVGKLKEVSETRGYPP